MTPVAPTKTASAGPFRKIKNRVDLYNHDRTTQKVTLDQNLEWKINSDFLQGRPGIVYRGLGTHFSNLATFSPILRVVLNCTDPSKSCLSQRLMKVAFKIKLKDEASLLTIV